MQYIYNVSQLPYGEVPEGSIYYNRITREIVSNSRNGTKKFKAIKTPYPVNAFSINGYFPLYATAALAESNSPLGTISQFDFAQLGEAPIGISYPVFMPNGLDKSYLGNYIDPLGDHDDDDIINFRDPQLVGIESLPILNYRRIDPFEKPDGTFISVKNYIARPDRGTYNNTDSPVAVATKYSGIVIDANNNITWVQGPGGCIIPPEGIFFKNINFLSLPFDSAGYDGDNSYAIADGIIPTEVYSDAYTAPGGQSVDIGSYLENGHSGYVNTSASDLFVETINAGIIVSSGGVVSYFMPGRIKVPSGSAWFIDVQNIHSPFDSITNPYNGVDPFIPFPGCSINMHDYIEYIPYLEHLSGHKKNPIDEGYINNTGATVQVQVPAKAVTVSPSCSISSHEAGQLSLPNGHVLICESSLGLLRAIQKNTLTVELPPEPEVSSIRGIQWWRETSDGHLELLPDYITTYEPAISYWEDVDEFSMTPREAPYVRYDESFQYFELDGNSNVRPFGEVVLPTYTLQLFNNPADTALLSGSGTYEYGSYVDISCEPYQGYSFVNWTGGGNNIFGDTTKNAVVQVNENINLTANTEPAKFSLLIDRYTEGSKSATGGATTGSANNIDYGTEQAITATPATGYNFTGWEVDDKAHVSTIHITLTSGDASSGYSVENTFNGESGEDITITIEPGDTITFTNNTGGHPLAIEDSSNTLLASESATITTYKFNTAGSYNYYCSAHPTTMRGTINVIASIANTTSDSTTIRMTEDRLVKANFDLIEYNVTASADNFLYNGSSESAGTAAVVSTAPYEHFSNISVSASVTDASKYEFSFWTNETQSEITHSTEVNLESISIDGVDNETLNLKAGDIHIFDWTNTISEDHPDGRPLKFSTTLGGSNNNGLQYVRGVYIDTVNHTTTIVTHAGTPNLYYYMDNLQNTGGLVSTTVPSIAGIDSIYNSNATISSLSSDLNLRAVFKLKEYDVVVELVDGEGSVDGLSQDIGSSPTTFSGSFPFGSTVELTANANGSNGYEFYQWGGDYTSPTANLSFTANQDTNLTVEFRLKGYTLTVVVDNDSRDDETNTSSPKWSNETGANVWVVSPASNIAVSNPSTYTFSFQHGDNVILEPQLKSNYAVMSWAGSGITQVGDNIDFTITSDISATLTVGAYPETRIEYDKFHAYFGDTFDILDGSHGGSYEDTDHDDYMASSVFSLDAFNQAKGTLGNSSNTYVNFQEDSYIELTNGIDYSVAGGLGDHNGDWAICFTLGAIPRSSNPWIFSRGNFALMHEGPPNTNVHLMQQAPIPYLNGKRIGGNNAFSSPEAGSTLIYAFIGGTFRYYLDGQSLVSGGFSTGWSGDPTAPIDLNTPFVIGANSDGSGSGFNGIMRNVVLLEGPVVDAIGFGITEYHTYRDDPTRISWYEDALDWLPLGNNTYPNIEGVKGTVSGSLVGGHSNDFITNPQCITLVSAIEGGAETDSIEVGLDVTDQQGLSASQKRTIEFGLKSYELNISIEDFNYKGTLETPGSSGQNSFTEEFTDVHFYATVDPDYSQKYEFSHWSGPDVDLIDDPTSVSSFIPSIRQDVNITAVYKLKQYPLTLEKLVLSSTPGTVANFDDNVNLTGAGTYDYGTVVEIGHTIDSNNQHFTFSYWRPTYANHDQNVEDPNTSPTNTIEIVGSVYITGVFDVKTYNAKLFIEGDRIDVDFQSAPYSMILSATGGTAGTYSAFTDFSDYGISSGTTYDIIDVTVEALESIDISCVFLADSSYGFIEWVQQPGSNDIADTQSATTTLNITRDNMHVMANVGLLPLSTFLIESTEEDGGFYFGSTVELTDISTAPSGDGVIESATYTVNPSLTETTGDTAVRLFHKQDNIISLDNVGDKIFDFNESFTILFNGQQATKNSADYDTFSRGHFGMGGYEGQNQLMHYSADLDGTSVRCAGTNMPADWKTDGWMNGAVAYRFNASSGTYGKFELRTTNPGNGAISTYGFNFATNYGAPTDFVSQSSDASTHPFVIGYWEEGFGRKSFGSLFKDFLFIERYLTDAEVDEFINADSGTYDQLSYYNEVVDWVELGSQTYPNITGKKGIVTGSLSGPTINESHFKNLLNITLPLGSSGDTTGSIDVTLTVTDDQGLTDTDMQTITFGLPPLAGPILSEATVEIYSDASFTNKYMQPPTLSSIELDSIITRDTTLSVNGDSTTGYTSTSTNSPNTTNINIKYI